MNHNDFVSTPYSAVYLIFRKGNKIALVLRGNTGWMDGHYCLPSGRVEKGEKFSVAASREAQEEVGAKTTPKDLQLILTAHRQHSDSEWIDLIFEAKKWKGELYNAEPDVHDEIIWIDPKNLPKNMVPNSLLYIEEVSKGTSFIEASWES